MQVNRRLYRCRHDRRLAGVAAGVAEFFDLDPTLVRVVWFLSIFVGGMGLFVYIAMAIIVPLEPLSPDEAAMADAAAAATTGPAGHRHPTRANGPWTTVIGVILIVFGAMALLNSFYPWADLNRFVVPVLTIGVGAVLIARAVRREPMNS
jgi:phage shock protein C